MGLPSPKTRVFIFNSISYRYKEQESQLVVEQLEQLFPPPKGDEPSELWQNDESTRLAFLPHLGQGASSPAWLIALSASNLSPHFGQEYSYIGIILWLL
jgi:hypothetical protein